MSYILDALRKAEAERERGTVPGIHAQPVPRGGVAEPTGRPPLPRWMWAAGGACVVLAGGVLWSWLGRGAEPAVGVAASVPMTPAVVATPAAPVVTARAPVSAAPPVASQALPAPLAALVPTAQPAPPVPAAPREPVAPAAPQAMPRDAAASRPRPPPIAAAVAAAEARVDPKPAAKSTPAEAAASAASDSRVYAQNELPEAIRRELPAISVGSSMYSPVAANRILFINGQVFHEGDTLAPGLVLEQIKLKAAVLRYKGYRYGLSY